MTLLKPLLNWVMQKRMRQIEHFIKYPHDVQESWLFQLINAAKNTQWGKKYGYNSITSVKQFKARVPIQTYDDLKPYIDQMLGGEQRVLWPTPVHWFAKSSGTTNDRSKFIPVTNESLQECHYKGGKDILLFYYQWKPHTKIFSGKCLVLGGSYQPCPLRSKFFYGDLSAVLIKNLPLWAELCRTPKRSTTLLKDFEEKIERIAHETLDQNVTSLTGVPTWNIILAKRVMALAKTCNLLEVWPNLELYFHGGVNFTPYLEHFKKLIPSAGMHYLETYNASEGFFSIQDQMHASDMLLMLDYGIYYEFLPLHHIGRDHPETLSLDQVQLNENYALVISTNAGLWRYILGDTIRFTSLSPYRIAVTGRTKHFINAFGEELIIDNAEKALAKACQYTGAIIRDYTACPIYFNEGNNGGHEWIIEFEKHPSSLEAFSFLLDNTLRELNSDYDAKRFKDLALAPPLIHVAPDGLFYEWMKKRCKLGGQNKVPRLANERKYVEDILSIIHAGTQERNR